MPEAPGLEGPPAELLGKELESLGLLGELDPLDGIGVEAPLDGAVDRVAELEPLLPDAPLWLEPELSHAASVRAESREAAISHVLPIR